MTNIMSTITSSKQLKLSQLYQHHQTWLYHWLQKKLGGSDHAADIAHDTWLRLFLMENLPPDEISRQYLVKIAKGLIIDRYRRFCVEQAYLQTLQDYPALEAPSAEQQYLIIETLLQLDLALSKLPVAVKQAFLLHRLEGKTYKQIAEMLNISVSSVEKYIARALLSCILAIQNE
ncbi:RNA polymerase sigma-70 factor, ECF subfamily [Acinetobacter puyangensis]|uniref:RNA polymerase sigma-70 factor, ECF subfamily n=2 Tax=Acinetobacter puyangensis TaxID=1096779 RepID=A0A240EEM3_9GAMM|nr:RNA polymerase sigma-70 factor, ECF subfamily [Acinetobacter puyangensis]